jgi:hypothetical protein
VLAKIADLKAGKLGRSHYMRITAPGGFLSLDDEQRLRAAGAECALPFLPDMTERSVASTSNLKDFNEDPIFSRRQSKAACR